jgi:hypothetical protein
VVIREEEVMVVDHTVVVQEVIKMEDRVKICYTCTRT